MSTVHTPTYDEWNSQYKRLFKRADSLDQNSLESPFEQLSCALSAADHLVELKSISYDGWAAKITAPNGYIFSGNGDYYPCRAFFDAITKLPEIKNY